MVDVGYILNSFKITNEYSKLNTNNISFYMITVDAFDITTLMRPCQGNFRQAT